MLERTISNIPSKILKFFTQIAEEKAIENQFKIRKSKLTPIAFIKALVASCFSQQFDLETFRCNLKKQKISIKKQSLFERFNERTVSFLHAMATAAVTHFNTGRLMQIDSINTTKPYRVRIEIYGKFIAMMILFLLVAPVRYQQNKEISFYKACKRLIDMASDFIRALGSLYRMKKFIIEFTENLSLFAIKDIKKKTPPLECPIEISF